MFREVKEVRGKPAKAPGTPHRHGSSFLPQARPAADLPEPPLKICVLAACPFPANHGTPGSIREMAEAVAQRGHEVHIVTYPFGQDIPLRGPVLHRIPSWTGETQVIVGPTRRRPLYDLQMIFTTLGVIRRHRPDLLHAHGYEAALVGGWCRLCSGLPLVYSGHNTMADELPSYQFLRPRALAVGLARFLDACVPRLGDRCLPHSANMDQFFRGRGLGARTEAIVPFGIDVDWASQGDGRAVRQHYCPGPGPVLLYTGVLDEFQRLDLLLEALRTVAGSHAGVKLLVAVTIPQAGHLARLVQRARDLGVTEQLVITAPQPLAAIRDFLAACDVAVVPRPQAPGFPIKLLNYLAAARPCVLFASSASNGLVHGENVFLAAPDSAEALAGGILEVLRDGDLRQRLAGNAARFVCAHHDRRVIAGQVCAVYRRTLAATGGRKPRAWRPVSPKTIPSLAPTWVTELPRNTEEAEMLAALACATGP